MALLLFGTSRGLWSYYRTTNRSRAKLAGQTLGIASRLLRLCGGGLSLVSGDVRGRVLEVRDSIYTERFGGEAVGTKLELAKAYLEIGDKDGAREILQEVAKEGSSAQKEEATKLIASL